jgi:hypothetical protein
MSKREEKIFGFPLKVTASRNILESYLQIGEASQRIRDCQATLMIIAARIHADVCLKRGDFYEHG